ncbi:hypothetical protein GQ43DRAFT_420259 [Delitschia confertaspora ATCC 74209]|uniref:TFIIS N-terminal domain-containing protein n=1 Tax=Delitschia confertaspora ATCC 74209 TaxID=1513339 RepID=A0A9P4JHX8_9PLEO|nr:hypothetical protein GQ43DRAFT_420259 [Delitschia confertaspora ATCC 74209]
MEDVKFTHSHDNDVLPEAGNDPDDPLRPEIDEENSTPRPPLADPNMDMEVTDWKPDVEAEQHEDEGLSSDESDLSEVDEGQFADFNPEEIAIEERPPQMIDETNVSLIGVHKRQRTEGEEGERKKKKKKDSRREKPKRGRRGVDEEEADGEDAGGRKSRKRKEGRVRGATPDENEEENLTPEERRKRALDRAMDNMMKSTTTRRRRKDGIDLEQMADQEIEDLRKRMAEAAEADNEGRQRGEPASHKLKLLPEVVALLNKNTLKESIVDPEINLLEAVRFFLEPLSDGSLPAYDIQKELFAALAKLPINKETLVASGIGKVIWFYTKSKVPEVGIKRQAERLFMDWTRPILRRTDDYRKKEFQQADFDQSKLPVRSHQPVTSQAVARAKALEAPRNWQRARMEAGPTTYTIVPKSNVVAEEPARRTGGGDDIFKRLKAKGNRR